MIISAGAYKGDSGIISVSIGPDEELCCYNKSGNTVLDAVITVFVAPV